MTLDPIGSGDDRRSGTQSARVLIKAGHPVVLRNSRGPQTLAFEVKSRTGSRKSKECFPWLDL